ncbi:TPA: hypothetical protein DCG61_00450 [Patescibacteria group bacterium]|nr:hypothetical protein [Patescibacteria group bacterium]
MTKFAKKYADGASRSEGYGEQQRKYFDKEIGQTRRAKFAQKSEFTSDCGRTSEKADKYYALQ